MQGSYADSKACVQVGIDMSEWFPFNVGWRQGCLMYIWTEWCERLMLECLGKDWNCYMRFVGGLR